MHSSVLCCRHVFEFYISPNMAFSEHTQLPLSSCITTVVTLGASFVSEFTCFWSAIHRTKTAALDDLPPSPPGQWVT